MHTCLLEDGTVRRSFYRSKIKPAACTYHHQILTRAPTANSPTHTIIASHASHTRTHSATHNATPERVESVTLITPVTDAPESTPESAHESTLTPTGFSLTPHAPMLLPSAPMRCTHSICVDESLGVHEMTREYVRSRRRALQQLVTLMSRVLATESLTLHMMYVHKHAHCIA
jgi:hypothetical protein